MFESRQETVNVAELCGLCVEVQNDDGHLS